MSDAFYEPWHRDLLDECRVARLATIAADGRPHLVPVTYVLVDGDIAIAIDEKPKRTTTRLARLRNIERDPRVTLLADRYEDDWRNLSWVRVDGLATVYARGDTWLEALAALRARYPQYEAMALEERPLIRITPERVAGWRASARP